MKFPVEVLEQPKNKEKLTELLKSNVCQRCIGRQFGMLGHGLTNEERGRILIDSIKNLDLKFKEPKVCVLCNNFFKDELSKVVKNILKKTEGIEFKTFLVGSVITDELARKQEEMWEKVGIEDVEQIKSEINREVGKTIEELTKKKFDLKDPDVTIVVDLNTNTVRLQIKSLYVYGKYQKLARGIPQTKWPCRNCNGKGCTVCKGEGKMYKTSVQEIVEAPFLKETKSKESAFHGSGREDIDARNLGWRPFVIEVMKPVIRKISLKEMEKKINKSKKVKVRLLKFSNKSEIKKIKTEKIDKTYLADVEFENKVDKKLLKNLNVLIKEPIMQQTPLRVVHRRADKTRKRFVKKFSYKVLSGKRIQFTIRGEGGLYIKELISGDQGRTKPSVSEIINNKVKKLSLDVLKVG